MDIEEMIEELEDEPAAAENDKDDSERTEKGKTKVRQDTKEDLDIDSVWR